jgi:ACS family sodium-dependent inorganic phosphate cotransporter/ACS family sodium-dependent inorganic phosphate cotransporter-like MFS transporter 9
MPSYFARTFSTSLFVSGLMAFTPWLVMAAGSSVLGILADYLVSRVGLPVVTVRKAVQTVAFLVPAAALMVLSQPGITAEAAVMSMTAALGVTSLGQAGFVANMSDIAPKHAGKMFGLCNTFGTAAGILGVTAVGWVVEWTGSFDLVFRITAAMYVLGVLVWNWLCVGEQVFA